VPGLGLPDHVIGHGLAQDAIHHRQVLPVVVSLEQGVALKTNKTSFISICYLVCYVKDNIKTNFK
jgi:hypothetical protein